MTTDDIAEDVCAMLRRVIETIIDRPRDLAIDYRPMRGRIDLHVTPNINDQGKIVGKGGAHIRALKYLMAQLGERQGQQIVIYLHENDGGRRFPDPVRAVGKPTYNTAGHLALLQDLLNGLLDEPPSITVVRESGFAQPAFVFVIEARRVQDYERLVPVGEGSQSLVTELGTLFRAAGHRDGVSFRLEVPGR